MNDVSNVSTGKPKIGGAIFVAPKGTALPTDAVSALSNAFKCLGYASEEGLTNENTAETSEIKAWGGDVVATPQTAKPDRFKTTLIETLNVHVLKTVYGDENVSGTLEDGITVRANSKPQPPLVWVFELILNDALKRVVIPEGSVKEVAEINYKDDNVTGYQTTINAAPSTAIEGDTHREYIKKATTTAADANAAANAAANNQGGTA